MARRQASGFWVLHVSTFVYLSRTEDCIFQNGRSRIYHGELSLRSFFLLFFFLQIIFRSRKFRFPKARGERKSILRFPSVSRDYRRYFAVQSSHVYIVEMIIRDSSFHRINYNSLRESIARVARIAFSPSLSDIS